MKNNEWKYYRLDEIGTIITGKTPYTKVSDNFGYTYQFITPRDMDVTKYIIKTERYLSKKGLESVSRNVVNENSVCVSCIGSDMGKVVMTKEKAVTNQQINSITNIKENFIPDFIYYSLKPMKDYFHSIAGGTTMPIINKSQFSSIEIKIPAIEIQQKISNILSIIDSKIEINNQINEKLEETAKAIYKEWFVNFNFPDENGLPYKDNGGEFYETELGEIPVGWEVKKLGDFIDLEKGLSYKGKFLTEEETDISLINLGNIKANGGFNAEKVKYYNDSSGKDIKKVIKGQIVVANTDITQDRKVIGSPAIITCSNKIMYASHHLFIVKKNQLPKYYLYLLMLDSKYHETIISYANGTTVLSIPKESIFEYKIPVPIKFDILNKFNDKINKIYLKMETNETVNNYLNNLKDLLLNKLMSGQIDVDKLNIEWDKLDKTLKEVE